MRHYIYNTFHILPLKLRAAALVLFFSILFSLFLEILGVGLIIPLLAIMTASDIVVQHPEFESVYSIMGSPSKEGMIIITLIFMLMVQGFKSVFLTYLSWRQNAFIADVNIILSQQLFEGYMRQPYSFHIQRNSAELIRNIRGDVGRYSKSVTTNLTLLTSILNFTGIVILLFWVELLGTLVVTVLMVLFSAIFFLFIKNKLSNLGNSSRYHASESTKHLLQGLGGIKDVKLLGREVYFQKHFSLHNQEGFLIDFKNKFLASLPSYWFEFIAVTGLASVIFSLLVQEVPLDRYIPTLGIFAVAAFRLKPAAVRILSAVQQLRFLSPSVNGLMVELEIIKTHDDLTSQTKEVEGDIVKFPENWKCFYFDKLSYIYPDNKEKVLKNINLMIQRGQAVGFIGESGSGKSTLIDNFLGLLTPVEGKLLLDKVDIRTCMRYWQSQIGYVPQSIYLTDDTLRRNIAFGIPDKHIDSKMLNNAVKSAQLLDVINELESGLDTNVGENGIKLSGGQRQRIGIARALYHNPSILVLDEATSALDVATERSLMEAVNLLKRDKTLIIIAHRLSTVANCDKLFLMKSGEIKYSGNTDGVLKYMEEQSN